MNATIENCAVRNTVGRIMDKKQRARQLLDMRCLGHTVCNYFEPDEFECDYQNAGEVECENCVCNFRENPKWCYMNPETGKWIPNKVLKIMRAIVRDERKEMEYLKNVSKLELKPPSNKFELYEFLRSLAAEESRTDLHGNK